MVFLFSFDRKIFFKNFIYRWLFVVFIALKIAFFHQRKIFIWNYYLRKIFFVSGILIGATSTITSTHQFFRHCSIFCRFFAYFRFYLRFFFNFFLKKFDIIFLILQFLQMICRSDLILNYNLIIWAVPKT